MRLVERFLGRNPVCCAAILSAAFISAGITGADGRILAGARISEHRILFSFNSETNEVLTVQSATSLSGEWQDDTNFVGKVEKGELIEFSAAEDGGTRFFRVKTVAIAPPPELGAVSLILKTGEPVKVKFTAVGGEEPLSWSVSGVLPTGLSLSADGTLSGTPAADAAEHNEDGRYLNTIVVQDSFTDRLTGMPEPRRATNTLGTLVRLSYVLNIQATRPNGPSLLHNCSICHSADFKPDITSDAMALINVLSGSGAECGTDRPYISPPDASDSLLYEKLTSRNDCGERMPFDGEYFSDRQLERLARWIRELTPEDRD